MTDQIETIVKDTLRDAQNNTVEIAAKLARTLLQNIADEKNRGDYDSYDGAIQAALATVPDAILRLRIDP